MPHTFIRRCRYIVWASEAITLALFALLCWYCGIAWGLAFLGAQILAGLGAFAHADALAAQAEYEAALDDLRRALSDPAPPPPAPPPPAAPSRSAHPAPPPAPTHTSSPVTAGGGIAAPHSPPAATPPPKTQD
jgi:hypothetical protein